MDIKIVFNIKKWLATDSYTRNSIIAHCKLKPLIPFQYFQTVVDAIAYDYHMGSTAKTCIISFYAARKLHVLLPQVSHATPSYYINCFCKKIICQVFFTEKGITCWIFNWAVASMTLANSVRAFIPALKSPHFSELPVSFLRLKKGAVEEFYVQYHQKNSSFGNWNYSNPI